MDNEERKRGIEFVKASHKKKSSTIYDLSFQAKRKARKKDHRLAFLTAFFP
jgi:hypothetical protein